ncbi:DnaD domain protein [Thermoanaerobacter wiegelii]|uniref:Primosome, DnaD subunit n=1 Tax=Thermoanaerobacter wiegelii Rt8.B1 TaxID=697303 RepID=G2MUF0_9THEO|nr:DnaD domain protein [Thermoanaerobacter wiegelii]AEM79977.1 primosome, DnaD subunit [Thermoanaerobacter wiegelii Rt8.B1]
MSVFRFLNENDDWGSTPISNYFINHFMLDAPGEYVKVYILGLKYCYYGNEIPLKTLADKLFMSDIEIDRALKYWEKSGLVKLKYIDGEYTVEYFPVIPQPTSNHSVSLQDPQVKQMFEAIELTLGRPLTPTEMETYLSWIDEYGFSLEIITMLVSYCASKNKTSLRYMEKVAIAWHDAGLKTALDVEEYLKAENKRWQNYRKILNALGLKEDELMESHKEMMDRWMDDLGFDVDVIIKACNECTLKLNEPSFPYINKILINWFNEGIRTVEDLENKKSSTKKKTPVTSGFKAPKNYFNSYSQRSYDIEDLEKKLLAHSRSELNE